MTPADSPEAPDRNRSAVVSVFLSTAVLAGGGLVLLGWIFDVRTLKGIRPGLVEMKLNTALGFAATGAAALLMSRRTPDRASWRIGFVLAAVIVLLGTMTTGEYVCHRDFHVDQLLMRDDAGEVGTTSPGRMALASAICFVWTGVGLMTLHTCRGGRCWPVNFSTSLILILSTPPLVGYVYGIRKLYGVAGLSEMAVHTAVLFIAAAVALMAARPDCGLLSILSSRRAGGYFARRVLPAAVLIPVALGAVLAVGKDFGTGDAAYAATLAAVFFLIVFVAFLWFTAVTLDRVDTQRIESEREIAARIERDKSADRLAESERRFRELANAMPQIVWSAAADGAHDYWNRQAADRLGCPHLALLGRRWMDCIHPDDRPAVADIWGVAIATVKPYESEHRLKMADGRYRWHLARGLPSFDTAGRVSRWFGTCTDIDDQRRMMDQFRDADRLKDQFLATMSHELRTPLTSILGWSTLLREAPAAAEMTAEALEAIHRNAVAQTRLVNDLLDSSRIVQGKLSLEPKPIEFTSVVAEAVKTAAQVTSDRLVNVDLKLGPAPVWINGDADRCRQIVINLVNNAIKFGDPAGRPDVTVRTDGTQAVLTVTNTGEGISPDFLPFVFDRFRQQDGSTTRRHAGLGLGLSIVKSLVDLHGGAIEAASDGVGKGARFTARFPTIPVPGPA
jgi:PAS domain S-box-containing protein